MSVFIKGMNMPQNCMSCPLFSGQGCKATHKLFHDITNVAVRVSGCPLVELPEKHGRLIDADALVPDICHEWNGWCVPPDDYSEKCIRKAPTVIEAEE